MLVAAPVALLAQGYNSIFYDEVTTDTLHGAFSIPIDGPLPNEINHRMNQYDMIVVDEAPMISAPIFGVMASTFNRVNLRPVVVLAGDKCQQQPLQTVNGRINSTTSILLPLLLQWSISFLTTQTSTLATTGWLLCQRTRAEVTNPWGVP